MKGWLHQPRVWLVLALAAILAGIGGMSFARRLGAAEPLVGVEWTRSSAGPVALVVGPGSPADRAGLKSGDLLVAIDGREVASVLDASELGWDSVSGHAAELRVRRGATALELSVHPEWEVRGEPYVYLAIVGLAFGLSGLFIALRWPSIRGGAIYAALAASLFAHMTLSPSGRADPFDWAISWGDVLAAALWPALLLHLGIALTKKTLPWRRLILVAAYGVSALLVGFPVWSSPGGLGGAYRSADPVGVIEWGDRAGYLVMSLAVLLTIAVLAKSYSRSSSAIHRSQMRWMLWGLAAGFGPFIALYAVPWAVGAAELPEWARFLAVVPMLLVPASFTAALARYRLYDFDVLLLRGLSEATALIFTAAVLSATVFLLRKGLSEIIPLSRSATRYVGFFAAAVAYPQMRRWATAGVQRAFYRQRYSYRATLLDWARELNAETDLTSLLSLLRTRIRETLGLPAAEVLVYVGSGRFETVGDAPAGTVEFDDPTLARLEGQTSFPLEQGGSGLEWVRYLFPMKVKGKLRAALAIAEREPPAEPLNSEDRALLSTLAAHAATAIEAARLVREVRQRAEEIGRLHSLQTTILESSAVGLLLLDREGRILTWNRSLEEMHGMSRTEAVGRELAQVFPLDVAHRIEREGSRGGPRRFRLTLSDREGRRRIMNIAISPVEDDQAAGDGGVVVTFDDVTQRVELEGQVLQQERLASLGLLAAGVAHEINTPLTGISSYTQLLIEGADEESRRDMLEKIESQTRRASGITRSLLNLARPDNTAFDRVDLNEAFREVLQLFEPQMRGNHVRLETRLGEELPTILGNKGKLQQVLLNLLLNARDAVGEEGEISVATSARPDLVILEVRDTGKGIPEEDLSRIFDPFFTTKGRGQGTGLGLSITFGIVREHRGQIRAESAPEGGTRFRVELPAGHRAKAMA